MISIVCVYNDKKILENYLLKSLRKQSSKYELITLDNTKGLFKSFYGRGSVNFIDKKKGRNLVTMRHYCKDVSATFAFN